jgi:hypothetical protein
VDQIEKYDRIRTVIGRKAFKEVMREDLDRAQRPRPCDAHQLVTFEVDTLKAGGQVQCFDGGLIDYGKGFLCVLSDISNGEHNHSANVARHFCDGLDDARFEFRRFPQAQFTLAALEKWSGEEKKTSNDGKSMKVRSGAEERWQAAKG